MSADNWAKCPQCGRDDTLREDYEVGMYNGKFEVGYYSKCYYGRNDGCGFEFSYKHSETPITRVPFAGHAP